MIELPAGPVASSVPRIALAENGDLLRLLARARLRDLWYSLTMAGGIAHYATRIETRHLMIRGYRPSDHGEWAALRSLSRQFLQPWEPLWPSDDLERTGFRRRLKRDGREWADGSGFSFLIFLAGDQRMIGGISLSHVRAGVSQNAMLGYWMGAPFAGHGLMTEAVGGVLRFAFDVVGLHRVEAVCLPHNTPSKRVLLRNGFIHEGLVRSYLKINGRWQDHELFGLIGPERARAPGGGAATGGALPAVRAQRRGPPP